MISTISADEHINLHLHINQTQKPSGYVLDMQARLPVQSSYQYAIFFQKGSIDRIYTLFHVSFGDLNNIEKIWMGWINTTWILFVQ